MYEDCWIINNKFKILGKCMNIGRIFELAGVSDDGILLEAAYDGMIASLKKDFPNSVKEIDDNIKQAKTILKKQDRMVWYIKILRAYLNNDIKRVSGNYNFISMNMFNEDLFHYYGYNIGDIENIEYKNQNISELFETLQSYINKYQQSDKAPVPVRKGDYELIKCNDGTSWWFVDRSYCSEEGRSGKHCGNVVGQHDKTQRILSLRSVNHNVILTFILLENGYLGEMKAKANLKPAEKYHANIMQLLLNPIVKGIKGAGYAPWMNFSIFDLPENDIKVLIKHGKPKLIHDQIYAEPMEFLKAPEYIKADKNWQQIAIYAKPELKYIIGKENDLDAWETAIRRSREMIIYAPETYPNFKEEVIYYLSSRPEDISKAPKAVSQNFDILKAVLEYNGLNIPYVNPNTPRYKELCKIAILSDSSTLGNIPEDFRTFDLCKISVSDKGTNIRYVPEEVENYEELGKIAVAHDGTYLKYIPKQLRSFNICKIAVAEDDFALKYVPDNLKEQIKPELNINESLDFSYFRTL
jgi:hypothetical protein